MAEKKGIERFIKKKKMTSLISKTSQNKHIHTVSRLSKKNLSTILLEKFLNQYGYEKGVVAAKALVEDIIKTTDRFYINANTLKPGQILWQAADKDERTGEGKTLEKTKHRIIKLTLFSPDDLQLLTNSRFGFRDIQQRRSIRLIKEAYQQNTALTLEDLLIILTANEKYLTDWIKEYQQKNGKILPIRGNVADIGPGITHKRAIIELHLKGYLASEIAQRTNHSIRAVDRYITDFERIKTLKERKFTEEEICFLTNRGIKIVKEYLNLIT